MDTNFNLAALRSLRDIASRDLTPDEADWLLSECGRLRRANEALDLLAAEKEREIAAKEADFTGLVMEWQDLSDELMRCKQDLELARLQRDALEAKLAVAAI